MKKIKIKCCINFTSTEREKFHVSHQEWRWPAGKATWPPVERLNIKLCYLEWCLVRSSNRRSSQQQIAAASKALLSLDKNNDAKRPTNMILNSFPCAETKVELRSSYESHRHYWTNSWGCIENTTTQDLVVFYRKSKYGSSISSLDGWVLSAHNLS